MPVATERTYTLDDLDYWPLCLGSAGWSADSVGLAVIGSPIDHSLSPAMHNAALAELAKHNPEFSKWRYFKFKIEPSELAAALQSFHTQNFRGLNLTVPHKALVVPYLDAKAKSHFVRDAGAANTLLFDKEYRWRGENTDGIGLAMALNEDLDAELKNTHVILLGAGGAGRAAAVQCLDNNCASLWIGNRTKTLREALVADLKRYAGQQIHSFSLKHGPFENLPKDSILINATSLGLKKDDESPIDLELIPRPAKVYDMIYRPTQTALLRQAAALGIPNANGLSMLVHQGAASLSRWTGETAPVDVMKKAVKQALEESA